MTSNDLESSILEELSKMGLKGRDDVSLHTV